MPPAEVEDDFDLCRAWDEERIKMRSTANSDVNVVFLYKLAEKLEKKII